MTFGQEITRYSPHALSIELFDIVFGGQKPLQWIDKINFFSRNWNVEYVLQELLKNCSQIPFPKIGISWNVLFSVVFSHGHWSESPRILWISHSDLLLMKFREKNNRNAHILDSFDRKHNSSDRIGKVDKTWEESTASSRYNSIRGCIQCGISKQCETNL